MNEATIRKWYEVFKNNNELVEIRVVGDRSYSGYFKDVETIIQSIKPYDNYNIYFTLNAIDEACYSRKQRDRMEFKAPSSTSDNDIIGRTWCLIDIDVDKPAGTNSTDEEKELAKPVVNEIYKFLRNEGFGKPVICDSANGFHLLIKQAMLNSSENSAIMRDFLLVLDMLFSTEKVKVDTSVFNASRICKLYGCYSRKGSNTPDRPQRESTILKVPDEIVATPNEFFKKVADMLPKKEVPSKVNNYQSDNFNLSEFISEHNIKIRNIVRSSSYTKYVLENCPFNSSHTAPDSAIFEMNGGGYGFKCLHASCSNYGWKEFRLMYDPNAYDKKEYGDFQRRNYGYSHIPQKEAYTLKSESKDKGKKWRSMSDIEYIDIGSMPKIPTGFDLLDKNIYGLILGETTVLSGSNSSGKSSWLNVLALNVINKGYKVGIWSGELVDFRLKGWINQSAAGKNYVQKKAGYDNFYYAPKNISDKIDSWTNGKLYLYNNSYGSRWEQLLADIKELIESEKVSLIVLDNLMALQLDGIDGDKNTKQKNFILQICALAKEKNVHIIMVAHPRKQNDFLRKDSISGTADLTNAVDNVFIVHRCNMDFETKGKLFFGEIRINDIMNHGYGNVLEVCKNRSLGVVDLLVPMYYEIESRRFKNELAENINYGWVEQPVQQKLPEISEAQSIYDSAYPSSDDLLTENKNPLPF